MSWEALQPLAIGSAGREDLFTVVVLDQKPAAERWRDWAKQNGKRARILPRIIKADNLRLHVFVVIVREKRVPTPKQRQRGGLRRAGRAA